MTTIIRLNDSRLSLIGQSVPTYAPPKMVETPVDHFIIIDCSGSMYNDIRNIREQLKNTLPAKAKPGDSITIIWFSGAGQFGTVVKNYVFQTVLDFAKVNSLIDRWIHCVGATGFTGPLKLASEIVDEIAKPGRAINVFFMSDGYDNQSGGNAPILALCDRLAGKVNAAAVVEYGYYCNRPLMAKMAETLGAAYVFAENFERYDPVFVSALQRKIAAVKKTEVNLTGNPTGGVVFGFDGDDLVTFKPESGKILVPETVSEVYYMADHMGTFSSHDLTDDEKSALYAGLAVFSQRMLTDQVFALLKRIGDVRLIKQFTNCFGKQAFSAFYDAAVEAARDPAKRLLEGFDPNLIPPEDAYTVLDALFELASDDENKLHVYDPRFTYKRIGRSTEDAADMLTEAEQKELAEMTAKAKTKKAVEAVQTRMTEMLAAKPKKLVFKHTDKNEGSSIGDLVFNSERPNVSLRIYETGTVDLTESNMPDAFDGVIPNQFETFRYRAYNIIRDGILNTPVLPVSLSEPTFLTLQAEGLLVGEKYVPGMVYMMNIGSLPLINRKMVKAVSAKALFLDTFKLYEAKAYNKVVNDNLKAMGGRSSSTWNDTYGDAGVKWLKEKGFDPFNGFSPKSVQGEATDTYMAKIIDVKISGYGDVPSQNEVRKRAAEKKPYLPKHVPVANAIDAVEGMLKTLKSDDAKKAWLQAELASSRKDSRALMRTLSEVKFAVIVGQTWFTEFASLDENEMTLDIAGSPTKCTVTLTEEETKFTA